MVAFMTAKFEFLNTPTPDPNVHTRSSVDEAVAAFQVLDLRFK